MHRDLPHLDYLRIHRHLNRWIGYPRLGMRRLGLRLHRSRYLANDLGR